VSESLKGASARLAKAIDRRRFMRRGAGATFVGVAALASGRLLKPGQALAYVSYCEPTGPGDPKGCGPSPACSIYSGACHCSNGRGGCYPNGVGNCHGNYNDWGGGTNCWTCTYDECQNQCYLKISTTCCDCAWSGCSSQYPTHCIAYETTSTVIGGCPRCGSAIGTVVGVATGDPETSWGLQPTLGPVDWEAVANHE
jgi:hypothetical protein